MKKRLFAIILVVCIAGTMLTGCGKENKYVNVGVEMSTAGMSLFLTNTAQELQKISTYVFFSDGPESTLDKLGRDKQGIDIAYLPVSALGMIAENEAVKVVYIDCFDESGAIRGVWAARRNWLKDAPNYSRKYIKGLALSNEYRFSHMHMSYSEALASVEGIKDFDFAQVPEVMQLAAMYSVQNKEQLEDYAFSVKDAKQLQAMFTASGTLEDNGTDLCRQAYDRYCTSGAARTFEEVFDLSIMQDVIDGVLNPEE